MGFSFFDDEVSVDEKRVMTASLKEKAGSDFGSNQRCGSLESCTTIIHHTFPIADNDGTSGELSKL